MNCEPLQSGERFVGKQYSDGRFLFQVFQLTAMTDEFFTDAADFSISGIFFQVVAEDSFPIGFNRIVNRMPVPLHKLIGTGSEVAESL